MISYHFLVLLAKKCIFIQSVRWRLYHLPQLLNICQQLLLLCVGLHDGGIIFQYRVDALLEHAYIITQSGRISNVVIQHLFLCPELHDFIYIHRCSLILCALELKVRLKY